MAENQVYLIKSGSNSFVEETEAVVGISGGKVGIGTTHPEADLHVTGSVKVGGDLTVDGTFTTINSNTISVDDKNIELGSTENPTDATADGGGITVKGATDKTFNWLDATDAWTSSEHLYLADGKHFSADELRALDSDGLKLADVTTSGVLIKGGKVGIHKATPVYDLDVDGSGNFTSLYVGGNAVLTGEGSIFGKWEDGATQGEIYYTGGNVGVGTNNPEYPLHVFGNAAVDGNFIVNGTSGNLNVSNFNVSGDSIVLNYLGDTLASSRGGLIVKDSSNVSKSFEYVEGSDFWNSNVGLNITNGGLNVASVSAVDVNGLTLGDDAGNGIFVEDGGQIGINTTSPNYNLHVNGSTHVGGEFSVGSEFKISAGGAVGGTAPASDGDIIKWDDANNKWVAGANVGGGGGGGVGEVPLATINSLPSGQSIYEIEFAETYNVEPRIATQLEIDGEGSIIPYVVSGVSTSGYHLIFAQDIPNNNYRIHTTFGGRDVHWETGAGASLYYNDGDVSIQRNFTIGGNLTVNGTTTTVNTETVEIEDHNLVIAANTGYNQLDSQYPAGGAYAGVLWGTGDAGAASPVRLTYQTNKGFAFEGGNVGIGTTNPNAKLELGDTANKSVAMIFRHKSFNDAYGALTELKSIGSDRTYGTDFTITNRDVSGVFMERLRIDWRGNVGIGTTNPATGSKLDVRGRINADSLLIMANSSIGLGIQNTDNTNSAYIKNIGSANQTLLSIDEKIYVKENGNVGIGHTNPGGKLHVSDLSVSIGSVTVTNSGTGVTGGTALNTKISNGDRIKINNEIFTVSAVDETTLTLSGTPSTAGTFTAYTDSNGLIVTSAGNVGIGTTDPGVKLDIQGNSNLASKITLTRTDVGRTAVLSANADSPACPFVGSQSNSDFAIYTNNSAKMLIDTSGNVGIGTTNPSGKLHVSDLSVSIGSVTVTNSGPEVTDGTALNTKISNGDRIKINNEIFTVSNVQPTTLTLSGTPSTAGTYDAISENNGLIVTSTGNVGIGIKNPGNLLHVQRNTTSNAYAVIENTTVGNAGINLKNASGDWNIVANADLRFIDNAVGAGDRMRITSGGNVGIGTTSPSKQLHIEDTNANSPGLKISASDLDYEHEVRAQGDGLLISADSTNYGGVGPDIRFNVSGSERMRIQKSGRVGIGTTNPGAVLHVAPKNNVDANGDPTNESYFKVFDNATSGLGQGRNGGVVYIDANYYLETSDIFVVNGRGDNKLTIKGSGNVGIGTTNPSVKLHINGGAANNQAIFESTDGTSSVLFKDPSGTAEFGNKGDDAVIMPAGVEKMRITSAGNVGIGTTNPGTNKLYVNGNIYASGTITPSSDDRVKHNEQNIVGAIETLSKLTPKKYIKTTEMYEANHDFELDADGNPVDADGEPVEHTVEAGVIAQQVLTVDELAFAVSPEGVDEDGNVTSPHGLNYNSLFTYAIAAIQEQQSIIEDLKSQNASLESRISALES